MKWPRWLVYLFPRLAPQGQWSDAVIVTDTRRLANLDALYAKTVSWVRVVRPDAVIAPERTVIFRVWPKHLRSPDDFKIGKVLAPNVIPGDTHGTLLMRAAWQDNVPVLVEECKHSITGESGHPAWLFPERE